jgi:hypothetical protein
MSVDSLSGLFSNANSLSLVTSGISGLSSIFGGYQKYQMGQYNAAIANEQATIAKEEAATEAQQEKQVWDQRIGAAITNAGASGVDPSQGSPLNVVASMGQQGELARQLALYRGTLQAAGLKQQAALDIYQGDQALYGGIATGGTTFLTGYGAYMQSQVKPPGSPFYSSSTYGAAITST